VGLSPRAARRLLAGGVLAAALYYAGWGGEYSLWDLLRLKRDRAAAEQELVKTRRETDSLRAEARKLENDPATIERVARERFGMIRPGETLYRFVPMDSAAARRTPAGP
jgi:cell division protein FtsB